MSHVWTPAGGPSMLVCMDSCMSQSISIHDSLQESKFVVMYGLLQESSISMHDSCRE